MVGTARRSSSCHCKHSGRAFAHPTPLGIRSAPCPRGCCVSARNGPDGMLLDVALPSCSHSGWSVLFHGRACGPVHRPAGTARRAAEARSTRSPKTPALRNDRDLYSARSSARVVGIASRRHELPAAMESHQERLFARAPAQRCPAHQVSWQSASVEYGNAAIGNMNPQRSDLDRHVDYIHYNPVKHGLVTRVCDWPYSSFKRYVARGTLPVDWGGDVGELPGAYGE